MRSIVTQLRIENRVFMRDPTVIAFYMGLPLLLLILLVTVRTGTVTRRHASPVNTWSEQVQSTSVRGARPTKTSPASASSIPDGAASVGDPKTLTQRVAAELLPGMLGMVIASVGLFGFGTRLASFRQRGFLCRLAVTPRGVWRFIIVQALHRFLFMLAQSLLVVAAAQAMFDAAATVDALSLISVVGVGSLAFIGLGFVIGGVASTAEQANGWSHLCFTPMLILSGAFFPADTLPNALQWLRPLLPMTYLLDGLSRAVGGGGGTSMDLVALLMFAGVLFAVTIVTFSPLGEGRS